MSLGEIICLSNYSAQLAPIHTVSTISFRVYDRYDKVPSKLSSTFPFLQLQLEEGGQVTTPCVKLSNFGILGLSNDVAVITD